MSVYFNQDFLQFFIDLSRNNHKDWFDSNRSRYEQNVKLPFVKFVDDLIKGIQKIDKTIKVGPKDCIFRINRDIRFAKDKTPYKVYVSAAISRIGKKAPNVCGFYFELNPECIRIYQGAYFVEGPALNELRNQIKKKDKEFLKLINDATFKKKYKKLLGDEQKRLPKEFSDVKVRIPEITFKNFYWTTELNVKEITGKKLLEVLLEHYKAGKALCDFLDKGLA